MADPWWQQQAAKSTMVPVKQQPQRIIPKKTVLPIEVDDIIEEVMHAETPERREGILLYSIDFLIQKNKPINAERYEKLTCNKQKTDFNTLVWCIWPKNMYKCLIFPL